MVIRVIVSRPHSHTIMVPTGDGVSKDCDASFKDCDCRRQPSERLLLNAEVCFQENGNPTHHTRGTHRVSADPRRSARRHVGDDGHRQCCLLGHLPSGPKSWTLLPWNGSVHATVLSRRCCTNEHGCSIARDHSNVCDSACNGLYG